MNAREKKERINEDLVLTSMTDGLTFGTDAYLLSAYIRPRPSGRAVDLGAGTGVISLLCAAKNRFSRIYAVEIQPAFCDLIRRNAEENDLDQTVVPLCRDVRLLSLDDVGGEVDAVFANPPYMRAGAGEGNLCLEKEIARHEVCGTIADFCCAAARLLKYGGYFTVVFRPDREAELLCAMTTAGLQPKRMTTVYATKDHVPCLLLCEAKKGAAPGMFVTKPLLLYENGTDSDEIRYIYENGAFHEQYQKP
ncbi:MAG: methyltransferase [Clostridia bacterium]|nr:methyltransferase [Clostridia bacterium]